MKALSLYEPWASLIMTGAKRWETRGWETKHRGALLICASMTHTRYTLGLIKQPAFQAGLRPLRKEGCSEVNATHLNFGHAVCVVDLIDCRKTEDLTEHDIGTDRPFGDFSPGRYAWLLASVCAIKPVPVQGRQRLFEVVEPFGGFEFRPLPAVMEANHV